MVSEIPDVWPPDEALEEGDDRPSVVVPMFPLRGVFLLPRQILPLHVFEPRYRQLVEDVLDGPGRLVMATVAEGEDVSTDSDGEVLPPRVLPVAGLGEIARHEKTPDGRYFIWLFGLGRFDVEEVDSDRLYRKARVRPFEEVAASPTATDELESQLKEAILSRSEELLNLPDDVPLELLADALTQKLHLPQGAMEPIFCEPNVARRARLVLQAHEAFPPPATEE